MSDNYSTLVARAARRLADLWRDGLRHPELGRQVQADVPGITHGEFNKAADIAWAAVVRESPEALAEEEARLRREAESMLAHAEALEREMKRRREVSE